MRHAQTASPQKDIRGIKKLTSHAGKKQAAALGRDTADTHSSFTIPALVTQILPGEPLFPRT